jgi:hypothetical protein
MAGLVLGLVACGGTSTPPAGGRKAASARIRAFQIQPAHQQGMLKLPAGVRTLAQVTVTRR